MVKAALEISDSERQQDLSLPRARRERVLEQVYRGQHHPPQPSRDLLASNVGSWPMASRSDFGGTNRRRISSSERIGEDMEKVVKAFRREGGGKEERVGRFSNPDTKKK